MARAKNKVELDKNSTNSFSKLMELIDSLSSEQREGQFPFDSTTGKEAHWERDKTIKDVLIHLYEWHTLLLNWVRNNMEDNKIQFLREGYNWRTYGAMNQEFVNEHVETSFEDAKSYLMNSHLDTMNLLNEFSDEELFQMNVFPWVGGSTLGSYFVSSTSSHYEWAYKKILKYVKEAE